MDLKRLTEGFYGNDKVEKNPGFLIYSYFIGNTFWHVTQGLRLGDRRYIYERGTFFVKNGIYKTKGCI